MNNPLNITTICVYCSSSDALEQQYYDMASDFGKLLGKHNYNLVYGGTNVGIMGKVAESAKQSGSMVIGVIPEVIEKKGIGNTYCDELIVTTNMSKRKTKMIELSDAFVALPGGIGTLEEIIEVLTLKQLKYHNKPIIFMNMNNFYYKLESFFQQLYKEKFAKQSTRDLYQLIDTSEEIISCLQSYSPPSVDDKWFKRSDN